MKFRELKKSLTVVVEPIYLVCGEDAFFVERSRKLILDACLKEPDFNLTVFDGSELKGNPEMLLSALMSYPFLADKRVVVVKEYYPLVAEIKVLKGYFDDPMPTSVLVILNSAKSEALAKLNNVCFVDCAKGDYILLSSWIINEGRLAGVSFEQNAISRLIDYCQSDMTKISGETQKLIAYSLNEKTVTESDVFAVCVKEEDYRLYEVVDLIVNKQRDKAYAVLKDMLGSAADGQKLFISLYNYFRRLLYASVSDMTNSEIADKLGVKEFAIKKAKEQAAKLSPVKIKKITDKLGEYDARFKSGDILQEDAVWNGILNVIL